MPRLINAVLPPGTVARRPQPVLELGDIFLRPWRAGDAEAVAAAYDDPGIRRWHARSMSPEEAPGWIGEWRERWNAESGAGWAVADESGVLGQIALRRLSLADGVAVISYWVLPAARGRRVAARALVGLSAWAFDELGLQRVELSHSVGNPASCAVAERAGFPLEGTKRGEALHTDGWHDMHLHARLAADPRP
ncbi:GNAT family protein [Phytomonospora sp. NPDC050363]|uniref:GNAT family N-acetyltransferase n=1 Tax=Phytomonospora sp. NPDC050363 TaxID=3155642 RepID=UPI0033F7EF47